ncbi:MAG: DUF2635 domain-containing protein [Aeromonas caviae]|nr:DUF2635 domain-containing protein [Aeromonas caviae]
MELTLKPKPGLTVRKPDGNKLAEAGETVSRNSFWLRRLADGDVTEVKPAGKATNKKTEK